MNGLIEKMRADLVLLGSARVASGEWDKGDERAIGQSIKAAIEANDDDLIGNWARWLAALSARLLAESTGKAVAADPEQKCRDCTHFATPGRTEGYCGGRDDLVKVYGARHPLSVLPKDGGLSCIRFVRRAA